jgi:general secretion pathway protein G
VFPSKISHKSPHEFTRSLAGFSIIEALIVITIIGILLSVASPAYQNYKDKRDFADTVQTILAIQKEIDRFYVENNRFPDSLAEIDMAELTDAWGTPYHYLNISSYTKTSSDQKARRDKRLKPVNSDYDLYSAGKDTITRAPFTAEVSHDDIVRCNNGRFLGYASDY